MSFLNKNCGFVVDITKKLSNFAYKNANMSASDWINNRQKRGRYTFSYDELKSCLNVLQPSTISNELTLLTQKGSIVSPYKGFYSVMLPHYQLRGIVPPIFYIDQLMEYLNRPYYISLLSAAELHGAAHQKPQKLQIFTEKPTINMSETKNQYLRIYYRKNVDQTLVWHKNSENGTVAYSSPELTAVDLVQYCHLCGGLSNASTVLVELLECTDFNREFVALSEIASTVALQRLGYIIEEIIGDQNQADLLYEKLRMQEIDMRRTCLSPDGPKDFGKINKRWKIIVNQDIELDEI